MVMETQNQSKKKYDVFISYSRRDFDEVSKLARMLKERIPDLDVWFDLDGIESGDEFREKIISAIKRSKYVLFALSEHSDQSEWTRKELTFAKGKGIKIIPVLLRDTQLEKMDWFLFEFGGLDCIDIKDSKQVYKLIRNFSKWTQKAMAETSLPSRSENQEEAVAPLPAEQEVNMPATVSATPKKDDTEPKKSKWWIWLCIGVCLALGSAWLVRHTYQQKIKQQEVYQQHLIDSLQIATEEALRLDSIRRAQEDSIAHEEARIAQEQILVAYESEQKRVEIEAVKQPAATTPAVPEKISKGGMHNGHAYVDLGLSVKWATCNIGANVPEEYGDYFAWGEVETKTDFSWSNYTWCNGTYDALTKYNNDCNVGTVDGKKILDAADDVAHVSWGGNWRMPTSAEMVELLKNCTFTMTSVNGVSGYTIKSRKAGYTQSSIFLPAAGYYDGRSAQRVGRYGNYWSSSLVSSTSNTAVGIYFDSSDMLRGFEYRSCGLSVRAVCE